jgi:hypothetical protein
MAELVNKLSHGSQYCYEEMEDILFEGKASSSK